MDCYDFVFSLSKEKKALARLGQGTRPSQKVSPQEALPAIMK
jgi:hypothetical protein